MKNPVDTGLSYSRLCEWTLECDTHLQEVIDIVYRRHIPDRPCIDRNYAELWLREVFLLPQSTKEKMGLFKRASLWDPHNREFTTRLIASGLRDRLIADLKREEKQGCRTKRFLDGILSRHNRCNAYPKRLEIPDHLRQVSGYETAIRIAEGIRDSTMTLTLFDQSGYTTHLEVPSNNFPERLEETIVVTRERLGYTLFHQLRINVY